MILGWHETVAGNSRAEHVEAQWGKRDYQNDRNKWKQNGHDSFLVELGKYGLGAADLAANLNWFSKVRITGEGNMELIKGHSKTGDRILLRFEMDTLVLLPYLSASSRQIKRISPHQSSNRTGCCPTSQQR